MFCLEIVFLGPLAMSLLKISKRKDPFCYCFFIVKEREEQGDGVACEQNNQFQIYLAYQCFFNAKYFGICLVTLLGGAWQQTSPLVFQLTINPSSVRKIEIL